MTSTSKKTSRRLAAKSAAAAVALCLATGAGAAYAYWAAVGAGSGAAVNGTMRLVAVEALVAGDGTQNSLVPGSTADVAVRAFNPNSFPVKVQAIRGNGAATADANHPGCTTTGVTFMDPADPLAVTIPANTSVLITLPGAAAMSFASSSGCQGATFSLPVTLEARK
ncbi:hypothetical protein [Pseudarthrobacter sp. fls2-241-R2A-168]|uniref:hypothetical protein n=1 Tax=Pseudarthrobacter sp. fls2-241-R2A-168 TaxID=3040304 RepID=UPI002557A7DA|nr:hypothetical protein [Pseudarthrobacter sp. fls2-241-R2A-168]